MELQCSVDTVRGYMLKYEKVSFKRRFAADGHRLLARLGQIRAGENFLYMCIFWGAFIFSSIYSRISSYSSRDLHFVVA
jgi:hypothetical protein